MSTTFKSSDGNIKMGSQVHFDQPIRSNAKLSTGVLDLSQSNYWICNCTGATTFSFANVPTDAKVVSAVLQLHNAGSHAMTFPTSVQWGGGVPTFTASGSDLVGFITTDGGANWRGMGLNFNSGIPFADPS